MNGFEASQTFYTFQGQAPGDDHDEEETKMSKEEALIKSIRFIFSLNPIGFALKLSGLLASFIREWKNDDKYFYRDQLNENSAKDLYVLLVDFGDVQNFDNKLSTMIRNYPMEYLKIFEEACQEVYASLHSEDPYGPPLFEVQVRSLEDPKMLRKLGSEMVDKMVVVPGIITSASRSQIKASKLSIRCRNCGDSKQILIKSGLAGAFIPTNCDRSVQEKCPLSPYYVVPEE